MSAPPPAAAPAAGAADVKAFAQRLGLDWDVSLAEDGSRQPLLVAEDDEELSSSYSGVELAIGDSGSSAGTGTVFVTTRRLVWVPDAGGSDAVTSIGCSYKQISMHAISRDPEAACAKPCVYLQLDEGSEGGMPGGGDEDEDEEEEEDAAELRLIPADDSQVEPLFQALCDASALNPDSDMEEEAGAQLFFDEAEVLAGLPDEQRAALLAAQAEGAMALDEVDELMAADPERFEDEDEDYEEEEHEAAAGGPPAVNGVAP